MQYTGSSRTLQNLSQADLTRPTIIALLRKALAINPLLTMTGIAMLLVSLAAAIGIFVDPRVITGVPAWVKPAKFAISILVYSFTLIWLLTFIQGYRRVVAITTSVIGVGLFMEMVIIVGQVIRGTTSHFNDSTPLDTTLFAIMGATITIVALMNIIVAVLLLRQKMADEAFAWSLRLGLLLFIVGMFVAFLMTSPTALQLAAMKAGTSTGIVGAHSVGVADGGPGLPFLGWSTMGGDLRIPHFVGLHALQILPLIGWLLSRRPSSSLRTGHRVALVWTAGLGYLGLIGLLTWQALRAQSVIAPDALTLQVCAGLIGIVALGVLGIVAHARTRAS